MNLKSIIFFIITVSTVLFPAEFYKLSELEHNEAKQDSGSIWVQNPIPDQSLGYKDTANIDLTYIFNVSDDVNEISMDNPVVFDATTLNANLVVIDSVNYLQMRTKEKYGHSYVSVTASTDNNSATDEFLVRVEDPDYTWKPVSGQYYYSSENTLGTAGSEWKAAAVFDLGYEKYLLNCIEFGYSWDGTADWEIVTFEGTPTDSVLSSGSVSFKGGYSSFVENLTDTLTGSIAVVFKTTANFMCMDPAGNSDNTWIYPVGEDSLWVHPEDISADYAGAWYIRLFSKMFITVPQNISTSIDGDTLSVSWSAVTNALSYLVYHSDDPYSGFTYLGTTDQTSYPVNVTSATKKFYYIKASNQEMK